MFNSLNSDGLPLNDSDIISAKLYASAEKLGKSAEFKARWEELLNEIGSSDIVSIDSVLMQQMYYHRAVRRDILTESGSVNVTTPGLRRYYIEDNKELISERPIRLCDDMINLTKIWRKVSCYPIIQVLLKFNENSKLFLASYFSRFREDEISEDRIRTISECLLRLFTVMELVDAGYSSANFKTFLFGEEVKLVDADFSEDEIKADFDAHISEKWDRDAIKEYAAEYEKNSLVYLNEFLLAGEKDLPFSLGAKYDVEHIMPQSGRNHREISSDAGIDSEAEFRETVNKLGNKILLEEKINRSLGNHWFRTKVSTSIREKTGYRDSTFPMARELVLKYRHEPMPMWRKGDIVEATEAAAERIVKFIFGE